MALTKRGKVLLGAIAVPVVLYTAGAAQKGTNPATGEPLPPSSVSHPSPSAQCLVYEECGGYGGPGGTYLIHIEYGAEEDMVACPGTPGRVVSYTALPQGADIECNKEDIP